MDERWLSVGDVSDYLGIRPGTVYKWVERCGLPGRKVGRLLKFRRSEIDEWVERRSSERGGVHGGKRLIELLTRAAPEIKKRFGIRKIGIFGSAVRNEARPDSDIDILVEFTEPTFDRYMELKFYLEDLFGRRCDLVLLDSLKKAVRPGILEEVVYA